MKKIFLTLATGALVFGAFMPIITRAEVTIDVPCAQAAVNVRETALIAAVDIYHTALTGALTTRNTSLQAAWAITDATTRRTARKDSRTAFQTTMTAARDVLKASRTSAYSTFNTAIKACISGSTFSEPAPISTDPTAL